MVAEATWGETIGDFTADLDRIIARRERLEADIGAAFLEHPLGKVLNSMCGFGPRTGARTLAEIGDPHRFANPARLAAYAGLAPVNWQSGRSHSTRRSRGGNHRFHNAMFIAAFVASQHDPDARAYYLRKRAQGKGASTPQSSASPADAPTSSWPCSKPKPPTNHASSNPKPQKNYPTRLDNKTGTPPRTSPRDGTLCPPTRE